MRYLLLIVVLGACARPDRASELAACQLISKSGDELARCLIMKYSWGADSAGPAKYSWQRQLDSIRRDHEEQAAAIIAARDAAQRDEIRRIVARAVARQRQLNAIDSAYGACTGPIFKLLIDGYEDQYQEKKAGCARERNAKLQRYGFPPDTL